MSLQYKDNNADKQAAMDLAESSRETDWKHPSFVAELFWGNFRPDLIHPFPEQTPDDKKKGDGYVTKLKKYVAENLDANLVDRTGQIPDQVMKGLAEHGCFAMKLDEKYGGQGLSQVNYNRVLMMVSSQCGSTGAMLSAHQSIGVPQPLKLFGTEEQKKKYFPQFAKGAVSAFALTEPGVGSDPAGMSTTGVPSPDGKGYILNGVKLWCTNGVIADVLVVMAKTPSVFENGREKKQITAFIVEKGMAGFTVAHRCKFMGLNGIQNGVLKFENVYVPNENIIWGLGKGLKLALTTLNTGRLTLPAASSAAGKLSLHWSRKWAKERKQWGAVIGKHEEISHKLAHIASGLLAEEAITWYTSVMADRGNADIRIEAAMAKLFCSEVAWKQVYECLQIRGGRGYETADSLKARGEEGIPVERGFRDLRINTILEGSTEIMHLFTAREALDQHMRLAKDILDPRTSIVRKLSAALKAGLVYLTWYPRQWVHFNFWPRYTGLGPVGGQFRYVARRAHKLARSIFHLMMIHQLGLERRQMVLSRVVEIGTELFAITATASYAHKKWKANPSDKTPLLLSEHFFKGAQRRIDGYFSQLFCNDDELSRKVASSILDDKMLWLEDGIIKDGESKF